MEDIINTPINTIIITPENLLPIVLPYILNKESLTNENLLDALDIISDECYPDEVDEPATLKGIGLIFDKWLNWGVIKLNIGRELIYNEQEKSLTLVDYDPKEPLRGTLRNLIAYKEWLERSLAGFQGLYSWEVNAETAMGMSDGDLCNEEQSMQILIILIELYLLHHNLTTLELTYYLKTI